MPMTSALVRTSGLVCGIFALFLTSGIVTAASVGVRDSADLDEGELYIPEDGELVFYTRERRDPYQPVAVASSSGEAGAPNDVKWTLGLGVLSNMQQFFDSLRTNLESLESLPHDEKEALMGQPVTTIAEQRPAFRPKATAAYLHALRNHRPSHKIQNFVSESEPANLRGSNHYDPNWLWTGLGRKR